MAWSMKDYKVWIYSQNVFINKNKTHESRECLFLLNLLNLFSHLADAFIQSDIQMRTL